MFSQCIMGKSRHAESASNTNYMSTHIILIVFTLHVMGFTCKCTLKRLWTMTESYPFYWSHELFHWIVFKMKSHCAWSKLICRFHFWSFNFSNICHRNYHSMHVYFKSLFLRLYRTLQALKRYQVWCYRLFHFGDTETSFLCNFKNFFIS